VGSEFSFVVDLEPTAAEMALKCRGGGIVRVMQSDGRSECLVDQDESIPE
jgi:hypothetical protein